MAFHVMTGGLLCGARDTLDLSILGIVRMELETLEPDMGREKNEIRHLFNRKCSKSCIKKRLVGLCNANNWGPGKALVSWR